MTGYDHHVRRRPGRPRGSGAPARPFDEFVAARSRALLRTAYLLTHDHALAEDLLQTALAKAWFAWQRIHGEPEPYVRKILVNTYASWWRRKWNGEQPTERPARERPGRGRPREPTDLWTAMERLPRRMRAVVVLRYFEDLTEAQTADAARLLGRHRQEPDQQGARQAAHRPGARGADGRRPAMNTLTDLRRTLDQHADDVADPSRRRADRRGAPPRRRRTPAPSRRGCRCLSPWSLVAVRRSRGRRGSTSDALPAAPVAPRRAGADDRARHSATPTAPTEAGPRSGPVAGPSTYRSPTSRSSTRGPRASEHRGSRSASRTTRCGTPTASALPRLRRRAPGRPAGTLRSRPSTAASASRRTGSPTPPRSGPTARTASRSARRGRATSLVRGLVTDEGQTDATSSSSCPDGRVAAAPGVLGDPAR